MAFFPGMSEILIDFFNKDVRSVTFVCANFQQNNIWLVTREKICTDIRSSHQYQLKSQLCGRWGYITRRLLRRSRYCLFRFASALDTGGGKNVIVFLAFLHTNYEMENSIHGKKNKIVP